MIYVTTHAIERWLERVDPRATWDEARAALNGPAIHLAADFGAPFLKLGTGQRVVIDHHRVITVLPKDISIGRLDPLRDQLHHHSSIGEHK